MATINYDSVVIGSGTAGIYYALKLAEKGAKVLVIDKSPIDKLGGRLDIFHNDKQAYTRFGIPHPKEGDPDFVREMDEIYTYSALNRYPKLTVFPFYVLKLTPFLARFRGIAEEKGVEFIYEAAFKELVYTDGKITGLVYEKDGETVQLNALCVADASGIPSVARRTLPDDSIIENFEITDRDKFNIFIHYVKLLNPDDYVKFSRVWPYYKTWIGPANNPDEAIFGVGANLSFDFAKKMYEDFTAKIPMPPHEIICTQTGSTPFRRPPYSLVTDGFIVLGDTACITKPYSGEGISAHWLLSEIAAEVVAKAVKDGKYADKESLWEINTKYQSSQGADFAEIYATIINAVDSAPEENDYEFKKDIVFNEKDLLSLQEQYRLVVDPVGAINLVLKILGAVITGKIKLGTVKQLLKGILAAGKLKKHYQKYPSDPAKFEDWRKIAASYWAQAGNIADLSEKQAGAQK